MQGHRNYHQDAREPMVINISDYMKKADASSPKKNLVILKLTHIKVNYFVSVRRETRPPNTLIFFGYSIGQFL
jgi:hypothetical protein